jgi:hypothetical protein
LLFEFEEIEGCLVDGVEGLVEGGVDEFERIKFDLFVDLFFV